MKSIKMIHELMKDLDYSEKILIYFATKSAGSDYDSYEQNYTYTDLNPITIRGIVRMISPEALVWKQYGLDKMGAIEIITEAKYDSWFRNCSKVEVDGTVYTVYKDGTGNNAIIQKRPNNIIRVVLKQK